MASISKPPILDETGKAILNELERLTAIAGPPGEDYVLTSADKAEIAGMVDAPVTDVQVNRTSILQDGVANVPVAGANRLGAAMVKNPDLYGIGLDSDGNIRTSPPSVANYKAGIATYKPVCVANQHAAAFYGLAKAAGDTTQSQSSNAVGAYTESAKSAISEMLGGAVEISDTTPSITGMAGVRYVCGECATLDVIAPATGCIDVTFTSGSTPTALTVTSAKANTTIRWANGFDPSALDADTVYEINVLDGELGVAAAWT